VQWGRWALGVALWCVTGVADAQSTGGSFGAGDWGESESSGTRRTAPTVGGGSGGYWGGGGSSSSGSVGGSSTGSGTGSGDDYDPFPHRTERDRRERGPRSTGEIVWEVLIFSTFGLGMLFGVGGPALRAARRRRLLASDVRVAVYGVSVDGGARREVQEALRRVADSMDTRYPVDRRDLMATLAAVMGGHSEHWAHVGGRLGALEPKGEAQSTFQEQVAELRARFRYQTVGTGATSAGRLAPRPEEGEGFCVVSLVVASHGELPAPDHRREGMERTLDALDQVEPLELVAFEIIWSPSEDADRMSSAELETLYPELTRLAGASAGAVHCGYCGARFARELGRCPTCTAPALGA